jgi:hypothetical protein
LGTILVTALVAALGAALVSGLGSCADAVVDSGWSKFLSETRLINTFNSLRSRGFKLLIRSTMNCSPSTTCLSRTPPCLITEIKISRALIKALIRCFGDPFKLSIAEENARSGFGCAMIELFKF